MSGKAAIRLAYVSWQRCSEYQWDKNPFHLTGLTSVQCAFPVGTQPQCSTCFCRCSELRQIMQSKPHVSYSPPCQFWEAGSVQSGLHQQHGSGCGRDFYVCYIPLPGLPQMTPPQRSESENYKIERVCELLTLRANPKANLWLNGCSIGNRCHKIIHQNHLSYSILWLHIHICFTACVIYCQMLSVPVDCYKLLDAVENELHNY